MKTIIKAMLGASMLMPIAAQAQRVAPDVDAEAEARPRSERRGEDARERPAPQPSADTREGSGRFADRADRPRGEFRPDPGAQPRVDAEPRPQQRDDRQDFRRERQGDRPDFTRERRDDRGALRNGNVAPEQFQPGSRDGRRDFRDDRHDLRTDRQDDRRAVDRGSSRSYQWNGNSGWNDRDRRGSGYGSQRGDNWARDWRNDRRYDWNRYRSSNRNAYRLPRYYAPYGWGYGYRRFSIGVTLQSVLWSQDYWIDDPYLYRLPEAYGPYRWVRYYNDALLIDVRNGRVVDLVNDIFW